MSDENVELDIEWLAFCDRFCAHDTLVFIDDTIVVTNADGSSLFAFSEVMTALEPRVMAFQILGECIVLQCQSSATDKQLAALNGTTVPVKTYLSFIAPQLQQQVIKAYHWVQWDQCSQFCGRCGQRLLRRLHQTEKCCGGCQRSFFPRFSPAIMVVIRDGARILLARSPHFPPKVYSALAGFIDIGESAEAAVVREVKEEVGLEIKNVTYVGSQTWPFPDSFMIAFTAEYAAGELMLNDEEIEDAAWFDTTHLPKLPNPASISRDLIEHVLSQITTG